MPLPLHGEVQLVHPGDIRPAYLIRIPESAWATFQRSRGGITATIDGALALTVAGERIPLDAHEGTSTDIHSYDGTLSHVAVATTRLNVPLKPAPHPKIPLKTRVVQLLAAGPITAEELVGRIEGNEGDIMRIVKVVGRSSDDSYSLHPSQYAKIKLDYDYTPQDLESVITHARAAFDELNLPVDAPERVDLEQKIALLPSPEPQLDEIPTEAEPTTPHRSPTPDGITEFSHSAEQMRDRYEELYPAYQNLTRKLVGLYHSTEDALESEDTENMIVKWRRWHGELAEIRRWFVD